MKYIICFTPPKNYSAIVRQLIYSNPIINTLHLKEYAFCIYNYFALSNSLSNSDCSSSRLGR